MPRINPACTAPLFDTCLPRPIHHSRHDVRPRAHGVLARWKGADVPECDARNGPERCVWAGYVHYGAVRCDVCSIDRRHRHTCVNACRNLNCWWPLWKMAILKGHCRSRRSCAASGSAGGPSVSRSTGGAYATYAASLCRALLCVFRGQATVTCVGRGVHRSNARFPEGSPRLLVPQQGNLYVVDDPVGATGTTAPMRLLFDKASTGCSGSAIDPQVCGCVAVSLCHCVAVSLCVGAVCVATGVAHRVEPDFP